MLDNRLKIGITQGDTNGVGWEVTLKALSNPMMCELCTPVVYGSKQVADFYAQRMQDVEPVQFYICASAADARRGAVNLVECGDKDVKVEPGVASEAAARAAGAQKGMDSVRISARTMQRNFLIRGTSSAVFYGASCTCGIGHPLTV
jgi:4-hydroxy-L-threonine phosphate dehydrogenase PdxA